MLLSRAGVAIVAAGREGDADPGAELPAGGESGEGTHPWEVADPAKQAATLEELPVGGHKRAVQLDRQGQEGGVVEREAKLAA
jgi:hypothetical protein